MAELHSEPIPLSRQTTRSLACPPGCLSLGQGRPSLAKGGCDPAQLRNGGLPVAEGGRERLPYHSSKEVVYWLSMYRTAVALGYVGSSVWNQLVTPVLGLSSLGFALPLQVDSAYVA